MHIADLHAEEKEALRNDVFRTVQESGLPCFWYAIHVAGLHSFYKDREYAHDEARRIASSSTHGLKERSPRKSPPSMHVELFLGLYGHLIAFFHERERNNLSVEIRMDRVDNPIVRKFEAVASRLPNFNPRVEEATAFDPITKTVHKHRIQIDFKLPPQIKIDVNVQRLILNPIKGTDGLVLAADVLANSLNHLFVNRTSEELYRPLNTGGAMLKHPLAGNLNAFHNWGTGDFTGDRMYKHPKAPT